MDDDCASPKHEVFTEEHPSLVRALSGIDRVLRYAIPALVGRVWLGGVLVRLRLRLGLGLKTSVACEPA